MKSKNFDYKKLKAILEEQGVSVEQLARMTGKTKKAVQPWLNGTTTPHKSTLEKIIQVLHISEERITKDMIPITSIASDRLKQTEEMLYNVILPFFSYYEANTSAYDVSQMANLINRLGGFEGKSLTLMNRDKTKPSLIKEMNPTIEAMKTFVDNPDFPLERMKNLSRGLLVELAKKVVREDYANYDEHELYRGVILHVLEDAEKLFVSSDEMMKLHDLLIRNSLVAISSVTSVELLSKVHHHCAVVYNLFKLDEELISDIIFAEKDSYPYFIQFYLSCFYDTNFSDTMAEYMERYTNPKNPEIEVTLTSYFEDRVKSLPDNIIKREHARRLLYDLNQLILDKEVEQWIKEKYPKFNYQEDSNLVKFVQKIVLLIDDDVRKQCLSLIEENTNIIELETAIVLEELPKILKSF